MSDLADHGETTLTTPRAALLAFADYLTEHDMPAPLPSSIYAQLAREFAEKLPEQACLDVDQQLRCHALTAAAAAIGPMLSIAVIPDFADAAGAAVCEVAEAFLPWLRDGAR